MAKRPTTVGEYVAAAPKEARAKLREMRSLLRSVAPRATEAIRWGNPVFVEGRILFAFAAYRDHLNFMPTPAALKPFAAELRKHRTGKGSIQLPYDEPLPKGLLRRVAAYRLRDVRENDARWM